MKLRVLIADPDRNFQKTMTKLLSQEEDMEAAGVSSDGLDALSKIETLRPDVVLLELVQPRLDGMGILRRLAKQEGAPPILVLTAFVNAAVVAECAELGAAYFMPKPCDFHELVRHLRQCAKRRNKQFAASPGKTAERSETERSDRALETVVADILCEIGIPTHTKGYTYLCEGILVGVRNADAITAITRVIYPAVARKFSTTPANVELSIRHAIEVAWEHGNEEARQKYFCGAAAGIKNRPTNREFITMIAARINLSIRPGLAV